MFATLSLAAEEIILGDERLRSAKIENTRQDAVLPFRFGTPVLFCSVLYPRPLRLSLCPVLLARSILLRLVNVSIPIHFTSTSSFSSSSVHVSFPILPLTTSNLTDRPCLPPHLDARRHGLQSLADAVAALEQPRPLLAPRPRAPKHIHIQHAKPEPRSRERGRYERGWGSCSGESGRQEHDGESAVPWPESGIQGGWREGHHED
jgi:hypothetical protein